jgi:tRNA(Ile)-lysidine synthase
MSRSPRLHEHFPERLRSLGLADPSAHLLVAVSGGCDSVTLLHLLRFAAHPGAPRVTAAHFDHAMRDDSAADALWVTGLCRAWEVPLVSARSLVPLRSEDAARRERHAFLRSAAAAVGAGHIATAHHADDQAETVLFRILRGTGLEGLAGIAPTTPTGLVRPLLGFWRAEIESYARRARLRWREDATNRLPHAARNRLRNVYLPALEREVAPGARRNLVRLAGLAREAEAGWAALLDPVERQALLRADDGSVVLARQTFRAYHPALGSRLLRSVLRRFGLSLSGAGTRLALQFITDAPSGRQLQLPGGVSLDLEFDTARISFRSEPLPDAVVVIPADREAGAGELRVGGRRYRVFWHRAPGATLEPAADAVHETAFDRASLRFPLQVRGWIDGDRIRVAAGRRRLKKLFGDRRIPRSERAEIPLLVDAEGAVLWVAGVVQDPESRPRPEQDALYVRITDG